MKNERVEKSRYLWSRAMELEARAKISPELTLEAVKHKCGVADFIVPILFGEIEHYQSMLDKFASLWDENYKLERRMDIKKAMDAFDVQFNNITEQLESNTGNQM